VVPGFVGYVLDRVRAGDRGRAFLSVSGLWVAGALACLVFTLSKGGWIAFGVGAVAFCAMLGKDFARRHVRAFLGVAAAVALLAAALVAARIVPRHVLRDAVASYDVRIGYWRGALAMARDHPVAGVGLGTFGANYARYRWPLARVAQAAHNDYLQVLAELGVIGLAAFLWLWVSYFRGAVARRGEEGARTFPRGLGYAVGVAALLFSGVVAPTFTFAGWGTEARWARIPKAWADLGLVAGLGVAWLAFFALLGRGEKAAPGGLCRKGLVCGMIAFLFHMTGDFDYCEPSVALTAWIVAALSVATRREAAEWRLRPVAAALLGAGALLATFGFQFVLVRAVRAEADHELARERLAEAFRAKDPLSQRTLFREASERYERAISGNPLDDSLPTDYGDMLASLLGERWEDPALFRRAAELYQRAAELNPVSAGPHLRLGELCERAADAGLRAPLLPLVSRFSAGRPPCLHPIYLPAVAEFEAAVERDPNRPSWRLRLALAIEKLGDLAGAARELRRAFSLNEALLREHPDHELSLRPDEKARARALLDRLPPER